MKNASNVPVATERRDTATRRGHPGERGRHGPPDKIRIRKTFGISVKIDGTFTEDQVEFLAAMDRYKTENRRPFPAWTEVLNVLLSLGYRKVSPNDSDPRA